MKTRSLQQWLDILETRHPAEIELGLDRIQAVAGRLGLSRPALRVVTVTGTNGKGSTCAFLDSLCRAQGLRTGLYASPHFLDYNERVKVNGEQVGDDELCQAFAAIEAARGDISLTYFETGTLAAFWIFARQGLDLAILEVGLGGRLDAVNMIDPDLAAVTSIGLDHADWLGHDREQVAYEKAGIFRPGVPALCGDLEPPQALLNQAKQLSAPLFLRGRDFDLALAGDGRHWHWRGLDAQGGELALQDLPVPALPIENAALAVQLYALLGLPVQAQSIGPVLASTRLAGRMQQVSCQGRTLILDVAHNPQAAVYIRHWLQQQPLTGRRHAVFGALSDKDVAGVIAAMQGCFDSWAVSSLPTPRSLPAAQLQQLLLEAGEQVSSHDDIAQALEHQLQASAAGDQILVFGSFFTVAQALEHLKLSV